MVSAQHSDKFSDDDMNQEPLAPSDTPATQVLRIFGIGSAGIKVLEQLTNSGIPPSSLIAIHSDSAALSVCAKAEKVHIDSKAVSRITGKDAAQNEGLSGDDPLPRLRALCAGAQVVFVVAGMGGLLGTSLSSVIARTARETGAFVLGFIALPFDCEGSQRAELAYAGLKEFRDAADLVVCWPNQKTLGLINEGTSLLDTFTVSNELLAGCVHAACRALGSDAAMGLRFLDLCRTIRNCSSECLFAVAEAAGANRAIEAANRLLAHPMLAADGILQSARTLAVCIVGGPALAMVEVNRIMEQLQARCEMASLSMGAGIASELGDTLSLAVLLTPARVASSRTQSGAENGNADLAPRSQATSSGMQLLENDSGTRRNSRFLPPPPALPPEKMEQLLKQQARSAGRSRKNQASFRQTQLPLEILSKGRFDKSEPTIHKGEDLDVPTYIRRGMALN